MKEVKSVYESVAYKGYGERRYAILGKIINPKADEGRGVEIDLTGEQARKLIKGLTKLLEHHE